MKKFILPAAAALLLAACNAEDNYIDDPVAASISAVIGGTQSRASDSAWDEGDDIGVSMSGRYTNVKYSTGNGDGVFSGETMYFKNKQEPVTLTAYYPYSGTEGETPSAVTASTGADRQTPAEQRKYDFLYAVKENVTGADPEVKFTFSHRMSKLTVTFIKGNDATDVKLITSCRINGLITEGSFDPVTGACSADGAAPASTLELTPTVKDEKALLPPLILFPQSADRVTLSITDSDNQAYGCELKFADNRLESGNSYLFTIKVQKTGLQIQRCEIESWTESENTVTASSE